MKKLNQIQEDAIDLLNCIFVCNDGGLHNKKPPHITSRLIVEQYLQDDESIQVLCVGDHQEDGCPAQLQMYIKPDGSVRDGSVECVGDNHKISCNITFAAFNNCFEYLVIEGKKINSWQEIKAATSK